MTIKKILTKYSKILKNYKITSAILDTEVILTYVLKKPKEYLFTQPEKRLTSKQIKDFVRLIQRRAKAEPVAYLTNNKEFFGLNFYVDQRVLVPRPETEILVEEVIKAVSDKQSAICHKPITISEIGTGSGCIAIALAKHLPKSKIIATDFSNVALAVAKRNAKKHKVFSKIIFLKGNLIEPVKDKKIDIICANLPYLDSDMKNLLKSSDSKSIKYEPKISVDGGLDGLNIYRKFFEQIKEYSFKDVVIFIEIGHNQTKNLQKFIINIFPQGKVKIKKDLAGLNRVMKIEV